MTSSEKMVVTGQLLVAGVPRAKVTGFLKREKGSQRAGGECQGVMHVDAPPCNQTPARSAFAIASQGLFEQLRPYRTCLPSFPLR